MRRWLAALRDWHAQRRAFVTAVQQAIRDEYGPAYEATAIHYHTSRGRPSFFDVARANDLDADPANAAAVAAAMVAVINAPTTP